MLAAIHVAVLVMCASVSTNAGERRDGSRCAFGGGGAMPTAHVCVPPHERAVIQSRIEVNRTRLGLAPGSFIPAAVTMQSGMDDRTGGDPFDALLYPFWPQSGAWFEDLIPSGYVDVDPAPSSFQDYACHPFTYDGHQGIDLGLLSFAEHDGKVDAAALSRIIHR